jgi:anaerobic ribonucleoside-triphosphate reductase activating protein
MYLSGKYFKLAHEELFVASTVSSCRTLGPGKRGVIWVSGCSRKCPGCIAAPIQNIYSGTAIGVEELAQEILSWSDIEGITLSGGEPFEQAGVLADLCDRLRERSKLTIMSFSGFTFAELQSSTDSGRRRLLQHLDILVEGPFIKSLQSDSLWRGSSNQQVIFLKDTYRDWVSIVTGPGDGVEVHISREGLVSWVGVPEAGFRQHLDQGLDKEGIKLIDTGGYEYEQVTQV